MTKSSVRVGTGTEALELGQVQAQGKKPMAAADWARGVYLRRRARPRFLRCQVRRRPDRARRVAFDTLRRVNGDGAYANLVLPTCSTRGGSAAATPPSPPSWWPVPAAARAATTWSSPPRPNGRRRACSRPSSTCCGWAPTRSWPPGAGPRRRGGHGGPGRGHRRPTGDRSGERGAAPRRRAARRWLDRLGRGARAAGPVAVATAHPRWIVDAYADLLPPEVRSSRHCGPTTPTSRSPSRSGRGGPR